MLRPARPEDAEAIAEVFVAARAGMTYLPHDPVGMRDYVVSVLVHELEVWVAEEDGRVAAFAALEPEMLEHLYVAPGEQGHGLGTALLAHVKTLRPEGFTFWVFQRNAGARRFYERHGCVLVRETDGAANMEREPDALYEWLGEARNPES
jgi:GNAT superfamily N-acetyltransferase